nr:uncharacterized protein LOC126539106 isoform X2 [Dermacentor andersoni]
MARKGKAGTTAPTTKSGGGQAGPGKSSVGGSSDSGSLDDDPSGVSTIPVALLPANGGSIRIMNPQAVQKELETMSNHFLTITDVRAFGRGGGVCRSPDETCVEDLLKCTLVASTPIIWKLIANHFMRTTNQQCSSRPRLALRVPADVP